MDETPLMPQWAQRVKPELIRKLYENDAHGWPDEELLDEVGFSLYSRCKSFIDFRKVMNNGKAKWRLQPTIGRMPG